MQDVHAFSNDLLGIDAAREVDRIAGAIEEQVFRVLRRRGAVLGLSGGIDSSVAAALCIRALGKGRVLGLLMPESDSSGESLRLGKLVADDLGIATEVEDITEVLVAAGCYRRRDEVIRKVIPEYGQGWRCKLVMPGILEGKSYNLTSVVVESREGVSRRARLTPEAYLGVVAATNFKQRVRKMME